MVDYDWRITFLKFSPARDRYERKTQVVKGAPTIDSAVLQFRIKMERAGVLAFIVKVGIIYHRKTINEGSRA